MYYIQPSLASDDSIVRCQECFLDSKEYGYMLRGALIGYTAFPKTFTDALYTNTDIYIPMDEYLTAIHKQVETQHPCD